MFQDHYKTLGVAHDAPPEQIKAAHRRLARQFHPDRNDGDPVAEASMMRVNAAYTVLMDAESRRRFDGQRAIQFLSKLGGNGCQRRIRGPVVAPPARPTRRRSPAFSTGGWVALAALVAGGVAVYNSSNGWDADAGRYRDGKGKFRRGRFT